MSRLSVIIKEEFHKFLKESDEDIDWDLEEKLTNTRDLILQRFLDDRERGIKEQPWQVVPFPRLKRIWEDYIKFGFVRDERGLDMIDKIIQDNIIKLYLNTELIGAVNYSPQEYFDDYDITDEIKSEFYDYITKYSDYAFNDFGGKRKGLTTLLVELRKTSVPEEKLVIIDQILNVVHQRSDLASWFVEGGSRALSQLSASPSELAAEVK